MRTTLTGGTDCGHGEEEAHRLLVVLRVGDGDEGSLEVEEQRKATMAQLVVGPLLVGDDDVGWPPNSAMKIDVSSEARTL